MPAPQTIIRLSVSRTLQDGSNPELGGNLLSIVVTEGVEIDTRIFVYQRDVASKFSPEIADLFWAVASVAQMETMPPDEGSDDEPFFRLDRLEAVFETPQRLEEFHDKIMAEIKQLQRANDIMIDPANSETICFEISGGQAVVVPCSSSSSSGG